MKEPKRTQHSSTPEQALERMLGYLKALTAEHPEIDRRMRAWRRDGYPSSTMGGGRGGGPSIVVDDDRVPVSTVEAAMFDTDEIAEKWLRYTTGISEALGVLNGVWAVRDFALADTDEARKAKKRQHSLQACANAHSCPDEAWAEKAGRCDTCYRYLRRTGRDRTGRYPQAEATVIEEAS